MINGVDFPFKITAVGGEATEIVKTFLDSHDVMLFDSDVANIDHILVHSDAPLIVQDGKFDSGYGLGSVGFK